MEADSGSVLQRVAVRTDDIPLGEQTVAQVRRAREERVHPASDRRPDRHCLSVSLRPRPIPVPAHSDQIHGFGGRM